MSLLNLLLMCISLFLLTCAWVMTDVVRRVGMSRAGAGLMVTEVHIMFVLVGRSGIDPNNILMLLQVTDTQGSEPRLSPRLSLLMRCYTTTATAVYTCTQHVHNSSTHVQCTSCGVQWALMSSPFICKHKLWSQLLSSVHVSFNKSNCVTRRTCVKNFTILMMNQILFLRF